MKAKIAIAFLLGTLIGQTFLGSVQAGSVEPAWTTREVWKIIGLLEDIEKNTRK